MMKKFIASILLTICGCFMLTACDEVPDRVEPVVNDTSRFQYIGQDNVKGNGGVSTGEVVQYYLDNKTNIVYIVMIDNEANGTWAGFTPLIDRDGTYVTYNEFIAEDLKYESK